MFAKRALLDLVVKEDIDRLAITIALKISKRISYRNSENKGKKLVVFHDLNKFQYRII